ncbi:MAG TPA: DUF4012 domain-containing protein [Chloroflexota bacterium]|jgi:hypothetical protein
MLLRRSAFLLGLLLLLLELVAAVLLGREGLRLSRVARAIPVEERAALLALTSQSPGNLNAGTLQPAIGRFAIGASNAQQLLAVAQRFQPLFSPALRSRGAAIEVQQGTAALTAVVDGAALAEDVLGVLPAFLDATSAANTNRQTLLQQLSQQRPALASALVLTSNLDREIGVVRGGKLRQALAPSLAQEQRDVPLAEESLRFALAAPALLGADGPTSYLVVAQDPADIRPTGGFMGSWGVLTLNQGQISGLKYQGYVPWEDVRDPQRNWPLETAPMQRYLGFCCLDMQDANWYPDFPTTALVLEQFSQGDQPAPLSGVIAFDPALVQMLLRVTGPVDLPAQHVTVTDSNLVDLANLYEGRGPIPPPSGQALGKQFLTLVAQALVARITHDPHLSLSSLLSALLPLLNDKHILLAFNAPDPAAVVADLGWDGAVATPAGDYLLVDETSMSDNKIDGSIARSITDTVKLAPDGSADVTAAINITNRFPFPVDRGAKTTDYRDFFRLYLPAGASAIHLAGVDDVWPVSTESGHAVASGYVVIPRGATRVVTVTYHVPGAVIIGSGGNGYALHVQVQPGDQAIAFQLHVLGPNGVPLTNTSASLVHDQSWLVPVTIAAGEQAPVPTWDHVCIADELVAGLKGPYDTARHTVPATCQAGAKPS